MNPNLMDVALAAHLGAAPPSPAQPAAPQLIYVIVYGDHGSTFRTDSWADRQEFQAYLLSSGRRIVDTRTEEAPVKRKS